MCAALPLLWPVVNYVSYVCLCFCFFLCMAYILSVFILFVYMRDMMYSYMRVYEMSYIWWSIWLLICMSAIICFGLFCITRQYKIKGLGNEDYEKNVWIDLELRWGELESKDCEKGYEFI